MRKAALLAVALLAIARESPAPLVCYSDAMLPYVLRLDGTEDGIRAVLGGKWEGGTPELPTLLYREGRWVEGPPFKKPLRARENCPKEFAAKNYALSNDAAESVHTVCAASGRYVYGGLSFYDGEGISGTGGLLRLDTETRAVELRRLPLLHDVSVNSIAADGDRVWFGTTRDQECIGEPFVHGLVRYDWSSGAIKTYEGTDDGPIGFSIADLLLRDGSLWVATDLGISQLDRSGAWHHYLPELKGTRERPAADILTQLLKKIPREALRSENFENQLVEGLALFRPKFLRSYLQTIPPSEWKCPELRFLASRMPDFATLQRRVLRFQPGGGELFGCIVAGFDARRSTDAQWRALLIDEWKKHSFTPAAFRHFRGDREIAQMLLASGKYDAIPVVVQILGSDAIPMISKSLSSTDSLDQAATIYALELATHRRIDPDGRVTTLPEGSDRPWYAELVPLEEFLNRRWFVWKKEERERVVAAWLKEMAQ